MTIAAHNAVHVYRGATKTPSGPVRMSTAKPKRLGWMECPASEFFDLLALHNAGEINLLAMPEYGDVDDQDEDTDEQRERYAAAIESARSGGDTHLARILRCFGTRDTALTASQIAGRCGLTPKQVKVAMEHSGRMFVGETKQGSSEKVWKVKGFNA